MRTRYAAKRLWGLNMTRLLLVFCVVGLLAACSNKNEQRAVDPAEARVKAYPTPSSAPHKKAAIESERVSRKQDPETLRIPREFHFPPAQQVKVAETWDSRIAEMANEDREFLEGISERYAGALEFTSEEEQRRLASSGFPMPEEWLAAKNIPDTELERLAAKGNIKAQMFYSDRLSARLIGAQSSRKAGDAPNGMTETQVIRSSGQALTEAARLMRSTDSPFAAYLYGRTLSGATLGAPAEPIAGSFFAARDRGDLRATNLMAAFSRANPTLDTGGVMASYSIMHTTPHR